MTECCINDKPFYQCCCKCKFHIPLRSHPWVDDKPCTNIDGYLCTAGIHDRHINKSNEHSCGCELYMEKEDEDLLKDYTECNQCFCKPCECGNEHYEKKIAKLEWDTNKIRISQIESETRYKINEIIDWISDE